MRHVKAHIPCDICHGKGLLWLGRGDYAECPQCNATGNVEVVQEVVQAKVRERYVPSFAGGYKKRTEILTPTGWST